MEQHRRVLQIGAGAVLLALGIRLFVGGMPEAVARFMGSGEVISFLVYMETGRILRYPKQEEKPPETEATETHPSEPQTDITIATEPEKDPPAQLSREDLESVGVFYRCDYRPDLQKLFQQPLEWDLTDGEPAVLIVHTHGTECYTPAGNEDFAQHDPYRTLDREHNMIRMGQELTRLLEAGGIRVIHDTAYHDYPDYNSAYSNARKSIAAYLREYPTIRMVLDLHRDASDTTEGQLVTSATVGGQRSAQLLLMVGTDAGGNYHPDWQENLALGLKLSAVLERTNPGICRPVTLRTERFNTDMTPGSLLVEVGAAGNSQQEALLAIHALAQGILEIAHGADVE